MDNAEYKVRNQVWDQTRVLIWNTACDRVWNQIESQVGSALILMHIEEEINDE